MLWLVRLALGFASLTMLTGCDSGDSDKLPEGSEYFLGDAEIRFEESGRERRLSFVAECEQTIAHMSAAATRRCKREFREYWDKERDEQPFCRYRGYKVSLNCAPEQVVATLDDGSYLLVDLVVSGAFFRFEALDRQGQWSVKPHQNREVAVQKVLRVDRSGKPLALSDPPSTQIGKVEALVSWDTNPNGERVGSPDTLVVLNDDGEGVLNDDQVRDLKTLIAE